MEDGDGHQFFQLLLNIEAVWRFNVLQVDATVRRGQVPDTVNELIGVGRVDAYVDRLYTGELIEQDSLALHHWLRGERTQIAKAKHSCAVGDHSHHVALVRVLVGILGVFADLGAGNSDAWRVCERQVFLVVHWLGRLDSVLAWGWSTVVRQCLLFLFVELINRRRTRLSRLLSLVGVLFIDHQVVWL